MVGGVNVRIYVQFRLLYMDEEVTYLTAFNTLSVCIYFTYIYIYNIYMLAEERVKTNLAG